MKRIFYVVIALIAINQWTHGQEQNKFRVGLDLGYAIPDGGGGVLVALEPKYNIADNMSIGLRFETAAMAKNVSSDGVSLESELASSTSYFGTFDYYFHNGSSSFAPFVGTGVGYSSLANIELSVDGFNDEAEVDSKFGGLLRAGFELGKFRVAASYNLIGKSNIEETEIKNSYFGISLGFFVGGGKW